MSPLISVVCLMIGTFIVLTQALLFCVGAVIATPRVQSYDEF